MGKRRSLVAPKSKAAPGENNALGGTLEEYFNSKAAYQPGQMLGLSSPSLLKHLLVGSTANNAMQTDKDDDEGGNANGAVSGNGATQDETKNSYEDERDESEAHVVALSDDKDSALEPSEKDACESPTKAASEPDAYDEDYESESSSSNADTSVAGMTLSDYLHAKAQDDAETDKEVAKPKANKPEPKAVKKIAASGHKKPPPPALISGMSLDHYLGAVEGDDACDDMADSKSPVSKAKAMPRGKQPALMIKSSSHVSNTHAMLPPKVSNSSSNYSHDQQESMLTPYQRRLKKKNKPRLQPSQPPHGPSHSSIGASILLMDAHSSSSGSYGSSSSPLVIAKSMNAACKDKKKLHYSQPQQHNSSYHQQPPLPKLQASASLHSLGHKEHESSSDELELEANEKLPPL